MDTRHRRALSRTSIRYNSGVDWTVVVVVLIAVIMAVVLVLSANRLHLDSLASQENQLGTNGSTLTNLPIVTLQLGSTSTT